MYKAVAQQYGATLDGKTQMAVVDGMHVGKISVWEPKNGEDATPNGKLPQILEQLGYQRSQDGLKWQKPSPESGLSLVVRYVEIQGNPQWHAYAAKDPEAKIPSYLGLDNALSLPNAKQDEELSQQGIIAHNNEIRTMASLLGLR